MKAAAAPTLKHSSLTSWSFGFEETTTPVVVAG